MRDKVDSIRLLAQELRNLTSSPSKPDWWSRASVVSGFLSSVVIALVGLSITSSIQKAQLKSSDASAKAQLEVVRIKNESDERIQQSKLEADLFEHLFSKDPLHRALALNMLHRAVPVDFYQQTVRIFAAQDPDPIVSSTAIMQLSHSTDPDVLRLVRRIANDPKRPQSVKSKASVALGTLAFTTSLSRGTIVMYASRFGGAAFYSPAGSLFTRSILQGFEDKAIARSAGGIDLRRLFDFVEADVPVQAARIGASQQPFMTSDEPRAFDAPLFGPGGKTVAIVVGISKYRDPTLANVQFSEKEASKMAESLRYKGAQVVVLTENKATKDGILGTIAGLKGSVDANTDIVFYFGGIGWSKDGQAYFATFESELAGIFANRTGLSTKSVMDILTEIGGRRRIMFLDMCTNDPVNPLHDNGG